MKKKKKETMGKRETPIPGSKPEHPKRKRREKQSFSLAESVNSMEEKSVNHTSDIESNNNNNNKKGNVISKNTMEPLEVVNIGTSLQTTEIFLQGKDKECVSPVDSVSPQSVKTGRATHLQKNKSVDASFTDGNVEVADNTSVGSKRSKSKGKHDSLAFSMSIQEDTSLADNVSQSVKTRRTKHLQKNRSTGTSLTDDNDDVADNTSAGSKRSKNKGKHDSLAFSRSTQEDTCITLQKALQDGLRKDGDADASKNVTSLEIGSKSNDESIQLGKGRTNSKKEKSKSSDTNAKACSLMQVPQVEEGLKEKDTSEILQAGPSFTYGIYPSNAEIKDFELLNKNHSDHFASVACKGDSSKDVDTDTPKNVPSLKIDSKSNDLENTKLGKQRKTKKKRKTKSPDTNAEACSPMQVPQLEEALEKDTCVTLQAGPNLTNDIHSPAAEITDLELVDKNCSAHLSSMADEAGSSKDGDANTSKNIASLEIDSKSNDTQSIKLGERRSTKKRKSKSCDTNSMTCISMQVSQVEEGLEKDISVMLQAGPNSTGIHSSAAKITDLELADKNQSAISNPVAEEAGSPKDGDADTSKHVACLEIDSKPNDTENIKVVERRSRKKRKNKSCNTNAVACSPLQVPQVEEDLEKGGVRSSVRESLMLPVAKVSSGMEKDPFHPVEVKKGRIRKEKGKRLVSEERTSENTLEEKNEDNLVPLSSEDKMQETIPAREIPLSAGKKLLVLDLNGLLCDVVHQSNHPRNAHKKFGKSSVFKRPFCDDFLKFCYERFVVGVWSSRLKENVQGIVNFIVGDVRNLSFCWDISRCTDSGSRTIENKYKPLVLKELKKLWNNEAADLPWKSGVYSPANTLLIDDSPYKALCNPPHTGIFPHPYDHRDQNDNSLGPRGKLRVYLEELALADNVQQYVKRHPFGKGEITAADASWEFYKRVINRVERSNS